MLLKNWSFKGIQIERKPFSHPRTFQLTVVSGNKTHCADGVASKFWPNPAFLMNTATTIPQAYSIYSKIGWNQSRIVKSDAVFQQLLKHCQPVPWQGPWPRWEEQTILQLKMTPKGHCPNSLLHWALPAKPNRHSQWQELLVKVENTTVSNANIGKHPSSSC